MENVLLVTSRLSNVTARPHAAGSATFASIFDGPSPQLRPSSQPISCPVCKLLTGPFGEQDRVNDIYTPSNISAPFSPDVLQFLGR